MAGTKPPPPPKNDPVMFWLMEVMASEGFDSKRYGKTWNEWVIAPLIEAARNHDEDAVWIRLGTIQGTFVRLEQEIKTLREKVARRGCCYTGSVEPCPIHDKGVH